MRKIITLVIFVAIVSLLQGCATPEVVETVKVTDSQLTCQGILDEIEEANRFEKKARDDRKVNGKNVAAAVLFWPALVGTYANTEEAIEAAKERREHLKKLYIDKNCK